jgi:hypothetical protein
VVVKADTYPLKTVFGKDVQYEVPLYQRPYVWRKDTHWEPLWEDLQTVVHLLLHPLGPDSHERAAPHFLGAIVLDQQRTQAGSVERRHIIDGQQRLTSLQLLIAAAASVANARSLDKPARLLRKLVENDPDLVTKPEDVFKVWPTNIDRNAFRSVLRGDDDSEDDPFNLVHEAHEYFSKTIAEWLSSPMDDANEEEKLSALTDVIRDLVQLVVIDLEDRDNAQVIFETLNARGTPLLAIDLVKNLMFLRIQGAGDDLEMLYRKHWRQFERAYWREDIRQGRLHRARAEIFLMHWLTLKTKEEVVAHHLYNSFRRLLNDVPAPQTAALLAEFASDARVFASFEEQQAGSPEHRFFLHLRALDTSTVLPLVLFFFRQPPESLSPEKRRLGLGALESWLVRRMLCGLTTKNYNRFTIELLRAVDDDPNSAAEVLIRRLQESTSETNVWPDDERVHSALMSLPLYKRLGQARVQMILSAIENTMRTKKSEEIVLPSQLTIEHVLPQSWEENWAVEPVSDPVLSMQRDAHVHLIGNLTLATEKLNASMSNAAWNVKRAALNEHSVLLMTRRLIDEYPDQWDESLIERRSEVLADYVTSIWPGPGADWNVRAQSQLLATVPAPREPDTPPHPEELIAKYTQGAARRLLEEFLDQVCFWEDVQVRVGKAVSDENRRIFFSRRGSRFGAFCRINPRLKRVRVRLTPDAAPSALFAEALEVNDPYRLQVSVSKPGALGEALYLARMAYEEATAAEDGE